MLQGEAILGGTTVEDLNLMMQLHHEESLMQSGKVPWYTPEYRALFEEGVRLKKIVPLGDHLLPLQPPTVPKESVGSEASMEMSAMYPSRHQSSLLMLIVKLIHSWRKVVLLK